MGKIIVKKGDITNERVDVIVNAANTRLSGGGGVDGAIHRVAGPALMQECRLIGGCLTGRAVMTGAGNLNAKKVIHTPGPVWRGGTHGEPVLLVECYVNCFQLAKKEGYRTIAFPSISTGVYGYPVEKAAWIALGEGWREINNFDEIRYICFSDSDHHIYERVYRELNTQHIDME